MPELQQNEIQEILERAQEISEESQALIDSDLRAYIDAAEEAGVPRDAALQAFREKLAGSIEQYQEGKLVFATAGDGWYNIARLVELRGSHAQVHFLSGGEANVAITDLRPFSVAPGHKLHFLYYGMWSEADVVSINRENMTVLMNYWGTKEEVPLGQVRLKDRRNAKPMAEQAKMWLYGAAMFLGGTAVGAVVMKILSR